MNIQQFAEITKITPHTIRYYEKIGLFKHIARNKSGHRCFDVKDIVWAEFVRRLKDTGMPLKKILEYAPLREEGEHTSELRMELLVEHATILESRLSLETKHLQKLKEKIEYYDKLIKKA